MEDKTVRPKDRTGAPEDMMTVPQVTEHGTPKKGTAFEVDMSDPAKPNMRATIPRKLQRNLESRNQQCTCGDVSWEEKHKKAAERREAYQAERLARIRLREEQCRRVDKAVSALIQQDLKRQGAPGSEDVRPMSYRRAAQVIQQVARGMGSINSQITADLNVPNNAE